MNWRGLARDHLPPGILDALRARTGTRFSAPFPSWEAAAAASGGYQAPVILERVRLAALAVQRGEAAFERDSVRYAEAEPPWPYLAALLRAALTGSGHLTVLDFGGSLGSTYHLCRRFLPRSLRLRWSVVEQRPFVECGRREFETDELRFHEAIEDATRHGSPQVALLSSVLQYLPDPDQVGRGIAGAGPQAILVDRTATHDEPQDVVVVQHVMPSIYPASYPFRVFGRDRLPALFGDGYRVAARLPDTPFPSLERRLGARYVGLLLERAGPAETRPGAPPGPLP